MKFALCNEMYDGEDFATQCAKIAGHGYAGVEIAPFTLAEDVRTLDAGDRASLRRAAESAGLEVVGLHWLFAKTTGLHMTTADDAVRAKTADYLIALTELCGDLGGSIMVLGSPQQRSLEEGTTAGQAGDRFVEGLKRAVPTLEARGVTLCLEPLAPNETDFMNTCADAREFINRFGSPSVALHQDVKAMLGGESRPIPELIADFADVTRHFHANDANLRGPGMGEVDFEPIFRALAARDYDGWVSVEVFDFSPGADELASRSIAHMQSVLTAI